MLVARSYRLTAPNAPDTPQFARDHVGYLLLRSQLRDLAETARLLVSEVVTNVYQHTGAPTLSVETTISPGGVLVGVRDASPRGVPRPRLSSPDDERGRGLTLVQLLFAAWGITLHDPPEPTGKTVWFQLCGSIGG